MTCLCICLQTLTDSLFVSVCSFSTLLGGGGGFRGPAHGSYDSRSSGGGGSRGGGGGGGGYR
jgi:hypothetical protein